MCGKSLWTDLSVLFFVFVDASKDVKRMKNTNKKKYIFPLNILQLVK